MANDRQLEVYKPGGFLRKDWVLPYVPVPLEEMRAYFESKNYEANCIKRVYTVGILELVNGLWAKLHSTIEDNEARISLDISRIPETLSKDSTCGKMLRLGQPARVFGRLEIREKERMILVERMLSVTDVESCERALRLAAQVAEHRLSQYRHVPKTTEQLTVIQIGCRANLRNRLQVQLGKLEKDEETWRTAKEEREERKRAEEERGRLKREEEERERLKKEEERARLAEEEEELWLYQCAEEAEERVRLDDEREKRERLEKEEEERLGLDEEESKRRRLKREESEKQESERRRLEKEKMERERLKREEDELWGKICEVAAQEELKSLNKERDVEAEKVKMAREIREEKEAREGEATSAKREREMKRLRKMIKVEESWRAANEDNLIEKMRDFYKMKK